MCADAASGLTGDRGDKQDDDFEWDEEKAESNVRKHKVSFDTARLAFGDPNWVDYDDPHPDEERYKRICMHNDRIYVVMYAERGTRTRIISARRANRYEQNLYSDP